MPTRTPRAVATRPEKPSRARAGRTELGILPNLLGYHLRRAQLAAFQQFSAAVGAAGITPGQFGVLSVIEANPGLSQTELGRALGIDRSTVVAVIDKLEAQGLVRRAVAPHDRRSHALSLSQPGLATFRRLAEAVRAQERHIVRRLDAREQAQLIELLQRIGDPD